MSEFGEFYKKGISNKTGLLITQYNSLNNCGKANEENIMFLDKVIMSSKANQEWAVFFRAIKDVLFCCAESNSVLGFKYVKMYFENQNFVDKAISIAASYGYRSNFLSNYSFLFKYLTKIYLQHYQMNEQNMKKYFDYYLTTIKKYSIDNTMDDYFLCLVEFNTLRKNKIELKKSIDFYLNTESDYCYVCANITLTYAYIFLDMTHIAIENMQNIIAGNIPLKSKQLYFKCENETEQVQYEILLKATLMFGKKDIFEKYVRPYLNMKLPSEVNKETFLMDIIVTSYLNDFSFNELIIEQIANFPYKITPYKQLDYALSCWVYFSCVKGEIPDIELEIFGLSTLQTNELAKKFEQLADSIGANFDKAYADFDYNGLKEMYRWIIQKSKQVI